MKKSLSQALFGCFLLALIAVVATLLPSANPHVTIKTSSLTNGTVGSPYAFTMSAYGGMPPYVWRVSGGALPDGLYMSGAGVIGGTPTHAALSSVSFKATDQKGRYNIRTLSLTIAGVVPPPVPGAAIWTGDVEGGTLADWWIPSTSQSGNNGGGEYNSGTADTIPSQDFAHGGSWSAKMTANTTGGSSGTRLFRWLEPQTHAALYYSVWYYIPQKVTPSEYWNLFQWKSKHAAGIDPFFVLNIGNRADGTMYFYLWDWQRSKQYDQTLVNIPVAQWFKVEGFYQCAADSSGKVTLWQDGAKLFDISGMSTRYADGDCQWSVDNYSNGLSPSTVSIYVDDAAIRTP